MCICWSSATAAPDPSLDRVSCVKEIETLQALSEGAQSILTFFSRSFAGSYKIGLYSPRRPGPQIRHAVLARELRAEQGSVLSSSSFASQKHQPSLGAQTTGIESGVGEKKGES